jgi:hypothetical protein
MKKLRLLFLGIVSLPVISVFACAESTSNSSSSGGTSSGTSPTSTSTKPAPCTGTDCANPDDSGSSSKNDGSDDGGNTTPGPDANNPANTLSLKDSGNTRFADQYFSNYTCPTEPGLGKVIAWTLPANIATALGIPGTGPFRLRVSSGNNNNAQILGPAPQNTVYFEGDVLIALLANGEVPVVTLASKPPASGGVILQGRYTCP